MVAAKRNIRVYERARIYPQGIAFYLELFRRLQHAYPYAANHWEVITFSDDYFWWARDVDYLGKSFRKWFNDWLNDEAKRNEIVGLYVQDHGAITKQLAEFRNSGIEERDNTELCSLYKQTIDLAARHLLYAEYTSDLFDDYFAVIFRERLSHGVRPSLSSTEFGALLRPATLTASGQYRRELINLFLSKASTQSVDELAEKFNWIKMGWDGTNELTAQDVADEMRQLDAIDENELRAEFSQLNNFSEEILDERNKLRNKYGLDGEIWDTIFYLLDQFNLFKDYRKEIQMRSNQIIYRVLREISRRFDLPFGDLMYYYNEEIIALAGGTKMEDSLLAERKQGVTWLIEDGTIQEYLGQAARDKLNLEVLSRMPKLVVDQFSGLPASSGKVRGRAFVAKGALVANSQIQVGDILIAPMTTVDFLPAMHKAGAIITDDGGVTCHAAVVSREFGVPCIVGTKVATQVLTTGDVVEVDADEGVVRIISRQ